MTEMPQPWLYLRSSVISSDHVLDQAVYQRIRELFVAKYAGSTGCTPADLTREYSHNEYLLVVDSTGQPVLPGAAMLSDFAAASARYPEFSRWLMPEVLIEGPLRGQTVLLAARWLCHLGGLRHITVELFLDLPDRPGATLVQIRGLDKVESPGDFDLPCAGHISGVDGIEASMAKELEEELGLRIVDLEELREVTRFDVPGGSAPVWRNREFRVLYQARLKAASIQRIMLREGEVAGLAIISLPELRMLVERYPERVASGLKEAIHLYQG